MRIVATIPRPLHDEHVIGVDPPLMPSLDDVWRRRINPFIGRALSDRALTAEQDVRSGIQRLRGQGVTAGVVSGLDLAIEFGARGAAPDAATIQVLPGFGLAQSGEDVVVSTPRHIALGSLPVYARVDMLDAIASKAAAGGTSDGPPPVNGGMRPLLPRKIGPQLAALLAAPAAVDLPRVAVLVAEPVTATIAANARDTCPPDPRDDPYDDLQRIDGVRLVLSFWPSERISSGSAPDYALPGPGADRRNRLAYRIFGVERAMGPGDMHPWEQVGVPIALVAFNDDWTLDFVDRASVVRLGGQPNPRTPLVLQSGTPILWQARVAQFVEQLAELDSLTTVALTAAFRQLPPVGFLPADVIDLATRRQGFFPAGFALSAIPVPLEHLDLAIGESAGLVPINLDVPDEIELLVPVPERVYEPGLLEQAVVDPAFARAMARYVDDRTDWLVRREMVRRRRDLLLDSVTGQRTSYPRTDLPMEEELPYPTERAPIGATRVRRTAAGVALRTLQMLGAGSSLTFDKGDRAYVWVRIVDAGGLTGLSLRFGSDTGPANVTMPFGVFWGAANQLPLGAGDGAVNLRRQGDLPAAGVWTRLEAPVDGRWTISGAALATNTVDGLDLSQVGGTIDWGPVGKIAIDGNETVWVADDAPPAATLRDSGNPNGAVWPEFQAGPGDQPVEGDNGTIEAGGIRASTAIQLFRGRWTQGFLTNDFIDLEEGGIDGFIGAVQARLKVTNDAIDLGFVRARSDIYRVRQYMLGGDAASRLVTSPTLADIASRQEGARATSLDLNDFIKTAYQSDFQRDADAPLTRKPKAVTPTPAPAPAPAPASGTGTGLFFNGFAISRFATFTSTIATPAPAPAPARTSAFSTGFAAREIAAAQPVIFASPLTSAATPVSTATAFRATTALSTFSIASLAAQNIPARSFNAREVQAQLALPGVVERTLSVAERLPPAPAVEAQEYAVAGKYAVVNALAALLGDASLGERPQGIALADLPAPGFDYNLSADPPAPRRKNTIGDVLWDRKTNPNARQYTDRDEKPANARHEADYFTAAVKAIDNTVALMRLVEGRIDLYNTLIADAHDVRDTLMGQVHVADARLRAIGVELEEARHDVGVATALLAEERDRVAQLNTRRAAILANNVKAIVYRRPRRADRARTIPVAPATAALAEAPVTVCLREHDAVPEELREYAGLFRDAALAWFPQVKARLDLIDRLEAARNALVAVRLRAANPFQLAVARNDGAPKMLAAVHQIIATQRGVHEVRRLSALQIDVAGAASAGLSAARQALAERASLADIIAGDHHRAALAKLAAAEVEGLGQVAGCLHASFGETPPIVRLEWAEMLSEFDRPAPLSQLAGLPKWSTLSLDLRRRQQAFVDWLFSRIDRDIAPAEAAINELVRIALLLAAHAPVERLIPARLIAPAPARIGGLLHLAVDITVARIGMSALIRAVDGSTVAHAVVDDLSEGIAQARIVKTFGQVGMIASTMTIHLSDVTVH